MKLKLCTICKKKLPLDAFHKRRASHDGRQSKCIDCKAKRRSVGVSTIRKTLNHYMDSYVGPEHTRDVPMKEAFCRACGSDVQCMNKFHWCPECRREVDAGYRDAVIPPVED